MDLKNPELEVNCRYCNHVYNVKIHEISFLTVKDYKKYHEIQQSYYTKCSHCDKYTATNIEEIPDVIWDKFWKNFGTTGYGTYYIVAYNCCCDNVHYTDRVIPVDDIKKNYDNQTYFTCPLCEHKVYSGYFYSTYPKPIQSTIKNIPREKVSSCTIL